MEKKMTHIVGIDEAGRGPLAGPVAVGAVCVPVDFDWALILGVGDSKKVTPKNREAIFRRATFLKEQHLLDFAVMLVSAETIDLIGITGAVKEGIASCLQKLHTPPASTTILLDGLLHAPSAYVHQETIIQGDAKERVIGLASICAKVTRDTYMVRVAGDYPDYHFDVHKGYGTKAHIEAIQMHGLSALHRRSFTKRFQ
jgi:ribonuclease HII